MFLPTDDVSAGPGSFRAMCAVPDDVAIAMVQAMAAFDAAAILRSCEVPILTISSAVPTNGSAYLLEANRRSLSARRSGQVTFSSWRYPSR